LKQTDFDGKYSYSEIVSVNISNGTGTILLAPNPASDNMSVFLPAGLRNNLTIQFLDIQGRETKKVVLDGESSEKIDLNVSDLPIGVYIVSISDAAASSRTMFIKQ
jgi:hypothetical protein